MATGKLDFKKSNVIRLVLWENVGLWIFLRSYFCGNHLTSDCDINAQFHAMFVPFLKWQKMRTGLSIWSGKHTSIHKLLEHYFLSLSCRRTIWLSERELTHDSCTKSSSVFHFESCTYGEVSCRCQSAVDVKSWKTVLMKTMIDINLTINKTTFSRFSVSEYPT